MVKQKMGNERLHFRSPNINVCFKASISGEIKEREFHQAVELVGRRHPLVNCVVHLDEKGEAWYLSKQGTVNVTFYKESTDISWQGWYEKTDNMPFDFEHGPLVKIAVFYRENIIEIMIIGHHIIGDGLGYFNYLRDILTALDGQLDKKVLTPPEENTLVKATNLPFLSRYFVKELNKRWMADAKHFSNQEYKLFFQTYRQNNVPGMHLATMDEENTMRLLKACKQHGVTVNEAIAAAFIGGLQKADERYAKSQVRLGSAASTRNEMQKSVLGCMGNYVTGIAVTATYNESISFVENIKIIGGILQNKLGNTQSRYEVLNFLTLLDRNFIESAFFAAYGNYDNAESKKLATIIGEQDFDKGIGISNLGKQNVKSYNKFTLLDVCFIPPAFPANLMTIGAITVNKYLSFCLRFSKTDIDIKLVEEIQKEAMKLLISL